MNGRPRKPESTPAILEARILEALRAAGGSSQRNNLRASIRPVITTADFDRAIAELAARGAIKAELTTLTWRSHRGMDLPYQVMVYSLPKGRRRRSPPPIQPWPQKGGRRAAPPPTVAEAEKLILKALREADGSKGRTALRGSITQLLSMATFDEAAANLVSRGLITAGKVMTGHTTAWGTIVNRQVMLYSLTKAGKKAR
jgi:hypothetical protein